MEWLNFIWLFIVPLLRLLVALCLVMSVMLFMERVYMGVVIAFVKLFGYKPEKRYKWEPLREDLEFGNTAYPMVLVQIPMYNEREVYQLSIGAACRLSWPSDRLIIQVLDDSTDPTIKVDTTFFIRCGHIIVMQCRSAIVRMIHRNHNIDVASCDAVCNLMQWSYLQSLPLSAASMVMRPC